MRILSRRLDPSPRSRLALVALAVLVLAGASLHIGLSTGFVPCSLDCGETYEAHIGALNLYRFGLRYLSGLQDFAASPEASAHPTIYTHNPNLGMYFMYALFLLGLENVHAQAMAVAVPFAAGLLYLYLFLRSVSRDRTLPALALLTAGSLYLLVPLWGFHALRGFSWLLTFAPMYHLDRFARRRGRRWVHLAAAMLALGLAFGIDYPFAVWSASTVLALVALRILPLRFPTAIGLVLLSLGVPFALRQAQVVSVVGLDLWAMDVTYSVARRVPVAGLVVSVPDRAALEALYGERNIIKWPGEGELLPLRWIGRVGLAYGSALGAPFFLLAAAWGAAVLLLRRADVRAAVRRGGRAAVSVCYVALALAIGQGVTFAIFAEYFAAFYGVLLMPLVVHWIVLLLALTTYLLLAHRRASLSLRGARVPMGAMVLAAFLAWRIATEVGNYAALPPAPYPGRDALEALRGHSVVTLWISSAVSAYTGQWAASLHDGRWRYVGPADLPFEPARDFYFFMEADKGNPRYRVPEFLFVPRLNVPWLDNRRCRPLRGRIMAFADGCSDLEVMARRLAWLPLHGRGQDYLIYDLRPAHRRPAG